MKKYIVTQDAGLLIKKWATNNGYNVPSMNYFDLLTKGIATDLQALFNKHKKQVMVIVISAGEMVSRIRQKIGTNNGDFIVSLDKAYLDGKFCLETNRVVRKIGSSWVPSGEKERPGSGSLEIQIDEVIKKADGKNIILVDDGCWTGDSANNIIQRIIAKNGKIKKVVFGLLITKDGLSFNVPIESAFVFDRTEIIDWICERDFIPGVPFGGRTVIEEQNKWMYNIGAYYLSGMGDPADWASLDFPEDDIKSFSRKCLLRSTYLFRQIELLSGKKVLLENVSRIPFNLKDIDKDQNFADFLWAAI